MSQSDSRQTAVLVIGDLLVLLSFVVIGRQSHALSATNLVATLTTALPFVVGWFAITPWFGIYRAEINRQWQRLLPRLLLGWIIAVPVAHVLRALLLGRSVVGGIPLTFVLVSLGYLGLVMTAWRLGYIWWMQRSANQATGAKL